MVKELKIEPGDLDDWDDYEVMLDQLTPKPGKAEYLKRQAKKQAEKQNVDPILEGMMLDGVPLTRDEYQRRAYLPDPVPNEDDPEFEFPPELREDDEE